MENDKDKSHQDNMAKDISSLYESYKLDNNIFIKIETLFNARLKGSNMVTLARDFEDDVLEIISVTDLGVILFYSEFFEKLNLSDKYKGIECMNDKKFLDNLKFCHILISETILSSERAQSVPLKISAIKLLSLEENDIMINLSRFDGENFVFQSDKKSIEDMIEFLKNVLNNFETDNDNDGE